MDIALGVISFILVALTIVVVAWRVFENSGVNFKKKISVSMNYAGETAENKECLRVFIGTLAFRLFMILVAYVIYIVVVNGVHQSADFDEFLTSWVRWDSHNYIRILDGYSSYSEGENFVTLAFFPLYPFLIKIMNVIIPNIQVSALLVSAICFSFASVYLYKLVCLDFSKSIAKKTIALITLYPISFHFGTIMSESAFLLTSVMTLFYIRTHKWPLAGICGMFAALSRSVGVMLIIPATVEFIEENKFFKLKLKDAFLSLVKKWSWLLLIVLGTCVYLYINYDVSGNAFEFLRLQNVVWYQEAVPFFKCIYIICNVIVGDFSLGMRIGGMVTAIISLMGFMVLMLKNSRRYRSMYTVWLLIYIIFNTAISWPVSIARYCTCAVVAFIALAEILDKHESVYEVVKTVFTIFMIVFFAAYFMGAQII